jgi:hypothetical protein
MPTRSTYVAVLVLVGIGLLFAGSLNAAYQESGRQYHVEDEHATVDYQTETSLDAPAYTFSYNSSITVTANNTTLQEGQDYEFDSSVGNITWLNSTNTAAGDEARVDYTYEAPTQDTHARRNLLATFANLLPYGALAVGVYAAIELTDSGW